jgi:protoporphyrinogen oxidase
MKTVVIGAGFAGLSAGHRLKGDFVILEKEQRPGGLCRTQVKDDFIFDYTGHLMHLRDKEIEKFVLKNTPVKMNRIARSSRIYSCGVYTKYPYQANNYGLPPEIIEENLVGFIRAKFAAAKHRGDFKSWVLATFGEGIAKNFMLPYNSKLWNHPLDKMTLSWLGRFVPNPPLTEILKGIQPQGAKEAGYNACFYYPERGGIESVIKGIYKGVKDRVRLGTQITKIDLKNKIVYSGKEKIGYEDLISTLPLKKFLALTGEKKHISAAKGLKATTVYALNIGYRAREKQELNWVYVPEKQYPFYRIGFPHTFSQYNTPAGMNSVFCEVSVKGGVPEGINERIINGLLKMGIIGSKKDIRVKVPMLLKDAYVIYDKYHDEIVPELKQELEKRGVFLAGRWGAWEYSSMEDAIMEGFGAADSINKLRP